ncbi:amidohydrolase family protein [Novosphingobium sp.]|uniref:amidohydrolase family protein n=1 Tax=Novosphingobium sp. TaxID=1874826 RepID=UPI0022C2A755|nr:amidohydrolase family protein [Novosphingobium sp.]MCZ8019090.1 amidohydrolase family protein [Novosphingobium sp.]MCZ8034898.1 amidohydrolase family protein [Novosphingobium sp.]MCZ8052466.1 amidohydrolase family protein [Novosphingobium sp.]MCZ8058565.1 amidohydrolase family protein [Novosphingobium sp.]MCZ8232962.1 amidohydrolase family protein [Novosphingobium sp.]
MSLRRTLLGAAALIAFATPAVAQDVAITNATVVIGDGSAPIQNGTVVLRGGKVVAAGAGVAVPAGIRTVDAGGKWVTPGLVVAVTDIGLFDVEAVNESNDSDSKSPFNAALDLSPAINPLAQHIAVSRAGGVTRAAVAPIGTGAIFGGQGAIIDLASDGQPITQARAFQYVELGEAGARAAGGSRAAAHAVLRNAFMEARELARRGGGQGADPRLQDAAPERPGDALLTRFDAAALVPVVTGRQPLYVRTERAADIRMALALKADFPALKLVIVGASEGWMVARELAAAGVPVLATPLNDLPASFEQLAATQSNVGRMAAAGVRVGLGAFGDQPRYAPQYAGNLVSLTRVPGASGLTWGQAFAAISSVPAAILGMDSRFGSLKPGLSGDVVIWDGDPLETTSGAVQVFIDGVEQSLENHQTKLRDRYKVPTEGALPKAYEW